jgi:hypothetical protein
VGSRHPADHGVHQAADVVTTLLERFTGTSDELEAAPVTVPQRGLPAVPGTSAIPWWTGVPGLDPDVRAMDWQMAAECSAMACAAQVLGTGAGRADWWRSVKGAPARKWVTWLLEAPDEIDGRKRILALRLISERAAVIADDHILQAAQSLHAACSPGMRPR